MRKGIVITKSLLLLNQGFRADLPNPQRAIALTLSGGPSPITSNTVVTGYTREIRVTCIRMQESYTFF
jgi:hypothetical protein